MPKTNSIDNARESIEQFYSEKYGPRSIELLDDGLFGLKELYNSELSHNSERKVIENIISKLINDLTEEACEIFGVKPLPLIECTVHWIAVMKLLGDNDWDTSQDFKDAGNELLRIKRITLSQQSHITEEFRRFIVDNENNPDEEW